MFEPLAIESVRSICAIQLAKVRGLLSERGIGLAVTPQAELWLAETGFNPAYGARPVKRLIQSKLLDPLATMILEVT
jgi:ATP-dependent Clp protease ATP-binding subunit ClpB